MNYGIFYSVLTGASILFASCGQKEEAKTVYEAPQKNPSYIELEQVGMENRISVSWKDNSTDEQGYTIWLTGARNPQTKIADLPADSQSYSIDEGLVAGETYTIGIQALGRESKLNSKIVSKEITLFDYSKLPNMTLKPEVVLTPTSVAVDYNFRNTSSEYERLAYGLCWSADHTPTIEDAHAHGPKITAGTVRQAIPCSSLDFGKTYKVRGYVTSTKATVYSNELEVRLGEETPALTFNWSEVSVSGLPSDIKVYKTEDPINGRSFNAWYAIADVTKGNVEFRFEFVDKAQKMATFYSNGVAAGEVPYVLTNAGYFNMSTGVTGDYHVEKGVMANSAASSTPRGTFGVDKDQKPSVFWASKAEDGSEIFFEDPLMTLGTTTVYERCTATYPTAASEWDPFYAMCAGPLLVKDGKVMTDVTRDDTGSFIRNYENIASDIFTDSSVTPDRTCVGYTADGKIILFVCDGRIPLSLGASIVEAAQIMKGLGCVGACNFDGGGSTAMLVQGVRQNSLLSNMTGGTEDRAVGSVMGFYKKK